MNFIIRLSTSKGYTNIIILIDYLSKGVIADRLLDIEAKIVVRWFLYRYYLYYYLPNRSEEHTSELQSPA